MAKQNEFLKDLTDDNFKALIEFLDAVKKRYNSGGSVTTYEEYTAIGAEIALTDLIHEMVTKRDELISGQPKTIFVEEPNVFVIEHYRKEDNPMVGVVEKLSHIAYDGYFTSKDNAELTVRRLNSGISRAEEIYRLKELKHTK